MSKLIIPEKRTVTMYGYVKPSNKAWIEHQAVKRGLNISQMLDVVLDRAKRQVDAKKGKAA